MNNSIDRSLFNMTRKANVQFGTCTITKYPQSGYITMKQIL
jgi:hypothetical protein